MCIRDREYGDFLKVFTIHLVSVSDQTSIINNPLWKPRTTLKVVLVETEYMIHQNKTHQQDVIVTRFYFLLLHS